MRDDKYIDIRRALWRWGNTLEYCEKRQAEIRQYQELCDDAIDIPCGQLDGMPRVHKTNSAVEDAVVRIVDTYEANISRLTWEIEEAMRHKARMDLAIDELSREEQQVIELFFKRDMGWYDIAAVMDYEKRQCKRYFDNALLKLSRNVTQCHSALC